MAGRETNEGSRRSRLDARPGAGPGDRPPTRSSGRAGELDVVVPPGSAQADVTGLSAGCNLGFDLFRQPPVAMVELVEQQVEAASEVEQVASSRSKGSGGGSSLRAQVPPRQAGNQRRPHPDDNHEEASRIRSGVTAIERRAIGRAIDVVRCSSTIRMGGDTHVRTRGNVRERSGEGG